MVLEWHTNGISGENSSCSIARKTATSIVRFQKLFYETKVRRRIFTVSFILPKLIERIQKQF